MMYRAGFVVLAVASIVGFNMAASGQTAPDGRHALFAAGALLPTGTPIPLVVPPHATSSSANAGHYDQIGTLFANDAIYFGPNEKPLQGATKIGKFYEVFLSHAKPRVRMASLVPAGPRDCFIELQGTTANFVQKTPGAIDHFTTDDAGKVTRLYIYFRPDTMRALGPAAAPALAK
jgi:hypothetical protein